MATSHPATGFAVRIERSYAAPPERVFDAFTKAEALSRWFGPNDEYTIVVHTLEARVGGRYRIEMKHNSGRISLVGGIYETVTRPSRLVFSWEWEDKPEYGNSRVTVAFEKAGTGTKLVLVHEQLPTVEARERHTAGWNGCLDRLVKQF